MTEYAIDWPMVGAVISVGLGSSVLTSFITHWLSGRTKDADARKAAMNNALYVAIILEEWAIACYRVSCDMEDYDEEDGNLGRLHTRLPELVNLRKEVDVSTLEISLRSKLLTLMAKINLSNTSIEQSFEVWTIRFAGIHATERGYEAVELANGIRTEYKLPKESDEYYEKASNALMYESGEIIEDRKKKAFHL